MRRLFWVIAVIACGVGLFWWYARKLAAQSVARRAIDILLVDIGYLIRQSLGVTEITVGL